jgi:hypothetical protein
MKEGDTIRAKRDLPGGFLTPRIPKGRRGVVFKVSAWSGKMSVRFDGGFLDTSGVKRDGLTKDDVERI